MITKASINRNGLGRLIIHGSKTTTLWCSRIEISDYLRHHDWHCFTWNGKRFNDNTWRNIILN